LQTIQPIKSLNTKNVFKFKICLIFFILSAF
jgi:hypothetical protein